MEMYLIQLMHVKGIEQFDIIKSNPSKINSEPIPQKQIPDDENLEKKSSNPAKQQLKNVEQVKIFNEKNNLDDKIENPKFDIKSFADLIFAAGKEKDAELKYDLERNVKLVRFEHGKIDINFNEKLNKNFIKRLSHSLLKWTGIRWIITLSKEKGGKTFIQEKSDNKKKLLEGEKNTKFFQEITDIFPDAYLTDVKEENE